MGRGFGVARWLSYGYALSWYILGVWGVVVSALVLTSQPFASDWSTYFDTARAVRAFPHADVTLYATTAWAAHQPGSCSLWPGVPYDYPPLFALLLVPLTVFPCGSATVLWHVFNLVLWLVCAVVLMRPAWRAGAWGRVVLVAALVVFDLPLIDGLLLGQVHLVILIICLVGAWLVARGRAALGGGVLAFGAWIKYMPAILVIYYVLRGRWRVALGAVLGAGALLLIQLAIVGPDALMASLRPMRQFSAAPVYAVWSDLPGGIWWAAAACMVFGSGVLLASRAGTPDDDRLGTAWALCTMLVMSPIIWWLYLTWLLPAFVVCFDEALRLARMSRQWLHWLPLVATVVALALSLIPFDHLATTLAITMLWALCGAFFLRSAGIRLPARHVMAGSPA